jgi:anti-sigma-K factor RskA
LVSILLRVIGYCEAINRSISQEASDMKHRLNLFGAWLTAEPWRVQVIVLAVSVVLALVAGLVPGGIAEAGPATGGS